MKKITCTLIMLLTLSLFISAEAGEKPANRNFAVTVSAGMRSFNDSLVEKFYKKSELCLSFEIAFKASESLEIFAYTDYTKSDGELDYEPKATEFKLMPVGAGIRMVFGNSTFRPYIGISGAMFMFREDNYIGKADESKFGGSLHAGARILISDFLFFDAKARYSFVKFSNGDLDADMGGISAFAGIGIKF